MHYTQREAEAAARAAEAAEAQRLKEALGMAQEEAAAEKEAKVGVSVRDATHITSHPCLPACLPA